MKSIKKNGKKVIIIIIAVVCLAVFLPWVFEKVPDGYVSLDGAIAQSGDIFYYDRYKEFVYIFDLDGIDVYQGVADNGVDTVKVRGKLYISGELLSEVLAKAEATQKARSTIYKIGDPIVLENYTLTILDFTYEEDENSWYYGSNVYVKILVQHDPEKYDIFTGGLPRDPGSFIEYLLLDDGTKSGIQISDSTMLDDDFPTPNWDILSQPEYTGIIGFIIPPGTKVDEIHLFNQPRAHFERIVKVD